MALITVTVQPDATIQAGAATPIGAVSISAALADSSDATYVRVSQRIVNGVDRPSVSFPTPTVPAGAKVVSVTLRDRVRMSTTNTVAVRHDHYLGCTSPNTSGGGALDDDFVRLVLTSYVSVTTAGSWVDRTPFGTQEMAPNGLPWDATSLASVYYQIGRSDEAGGDLDIAGVWLDVTYQRQSTVTITGPSTPNTATRPTVAWTFNSPDQQPQDRYRVAIYTAAQVAAGGFAAFTTDPIQYSGSNAGAVADRYWTNGADHQWTLPNDLIDGVYYAYVQVDAYWTGQGAFPTTTASTSWTRAATAATPPPTATLSSAVYSYAHGWTELTFVPSSASPTTTSFTVEALRDGAIWRPIPSATRVPANGMTPVTAWDVAADLNVPTSYRVVALSGNVAALAPSSTLTVTPVDDRDWFVDPDNPMGSSPVMIKAPDGESGIESVFNNMDALYYPIGGDGDTSPPKRIRGPNYGEDHKITLRFNIGRDGTIANYDAIKEMVLHSHIIRWKSPEGVSVWCAIGAGSDGEKPKQRRDYVPGNRAVVKWRELDFTLTEMSEPAYF